MVHSGSFANAAERNAAVGERNGIGPQVK